MKKEGLECLRMETKEWSREQFIAAMASMLETIAWYEMCLDGLSGSDQGDLLDEDDASDKWEVS